MVFHYSKNNQAQIDPSETHNPIFNLVMKLALLLCFLWAIFHIKMLFSSLLAFTTLSKQVAMALICHSQLSSSMTQYFSHWVIESLIFRGTQASKVTDHIMLQ